MKIVDLPFLPPEIANLIRMGNWSLYALPEGEGYVIQTEQQNQCCNFHPQKTYHVNPEGCIIELLESLPANAELVHLK